MSNERLSIIGTMNPIPGGGWRGAIKTKIFNAIVRVIPNTARAGTHAEDSIPPYHVVVGTSRIGGAWEVLKHGKFTNHLHVVLDELGLSEPMRGTLALAD